MQRRRAATAMSILTTARWTARGCRRSWRRRTGRRFRHICGRRRREASETFLHTGDGQLCDIIVDRSALAAIYECGKNASDAIIRDYAETTVAVADIKIAVRSQKTGKHLDFMRRAMAPCDKLEYRAACHRRLLAVSARSASIWKEPAMGRARRH